MPDDTALLLERHFDLAFAAPDGIKKLRELILTLAMQGKLVPQDPNDQPVSELLKEIEAEKQRLVKAGKIKPQKPLYKIEPYEIPYGLPEKWKWVRLGDLSLFSDSGWSPQCLSEPRSGQEWGVLKVSAVSWGEFRPEENKALPQSIEAKSECEVQVGDFLISRANTEELVARSVVVKTSPVRLMMSDKIVRFSLSQKIEKDFINLANLSQPAREYYARNASGTSSSMKNVSREVMNNLPIALPPLAEQHRIVAKIDQLMARCDELEKLRNERNQKRITVHTAALNRLLLAKELPCTPKSPQPPKSPNSGGLSEPFPAQSPPELGDLGGEKSLNASKKEISDFSIAWGFITQHFGELYSVKENVAELRKAILQLAVMGKLVPQDPNDQPASELLKEIEAEKQRLVKAGKIKQQKPLPEIKADEVPYELPEGWEWVRFGNIAMLQNGFAFKSEDYALHGIKLIRNVNISHGFVDYKNIAHYPDSERTRFKDFELSKGDILISLDRPIISTGLKIAILGEQDLPSLLVQRVGRVRAELLKINPLFLFNWFNSSLFIDRIAPGRSNGVPHISTKEVEMLLFPLPPLAEQHRIVAKIDQLMALCDHLEQQIDAAASKQTALLSAVMAEV